MAKRRPIDWIFIHTAAHAINGEPQDTTAEQIDSWHRARGWREIGYHAVVRFDGRVEYGKRSLEEAGAHVEGINSRSLGLCFSGHGDFADLTPAQKRSGAMVVANWLVAFGLVSRFKKNPMRVLGHREVNLLVDAGLAPKRTTKSCPGKKVSCKEFRKLVLAELESRGK